MTPQIQGTKEPINWTSSKLKTLCQRKLTHKNKKTREWGKKNLKIVCLIKV
jgi:hypothetical protein